jgi:predicted secreted hydrolase
MKHRRPLLVLLSLLCLLALLLASCQVPGVPATLAQLPLAAPASTAQALPPIRFPQDEAPHRDLTEWWYYTGHVSALTPDGALHHYGFELVFFQSLRSDFPPIYSAHFAISDLARGQFHYAQRRLSEPAALVSGTAAASGFAVSSSDWSARGLDGHDHLRAGMAGYTIELALNALKPAVLHNGSGLITAGLVGFSYYYSRPRMAVSGLLLDHDRRLQVTGEAWMDHQWGNFFPAGSGGWSWLSIQLRSGSELMCYVIRDAAGQIVSTYISVSEPDGRIVQVPGSTLQLRVLGQWRSPATGILYPSGWHIDIRARQVQASLTLQPELKDQELVVTQSTGSIYWEGAVSVQGDSAGEYVQGEGYVELTGYHR